MMDSSDPRYGGGELWCLFFLHTILQYQYNIKTFLFCNFSELEQFEMSLAFFIKPSVEWEIKHMMSTYMWTNILIPYLDNEILRSLQICFQLFTKAKRHVKTFLIRNAWIHLRICQFVHLSMCLRNLC